MASKRSLYKPVKTKGGNEARKPLAQGRLVNGLAVTTSKPQVLASGIDDSLSTIRSDSHHRSNIGLEVHGFLHSTANEGEQAVTPRKLAPQRTEKYSPSRSRPRDDLDLTDSDLDLPQQIEDNNEGYTTQQPTEVLLIDASRTNKDPDLSEVDIKVGFERTPVKVVCHSPSSLNSSLRSSVKTKGTQRVKIDSVPNVAVLHQSFSKENTPPMAVRKVNNEEFSPLDTFPVISQMMKDSGRLPQPNFNDSPRSETSDRPVRDININDDDALSVASDTCSVSELFTQKKSKKAAKDDSKQPTIKQMGTGKKKKVTVIPSRYMAAAENKVKSSRSLLEKSSRLDIKHKANRSEENVSLSRSKKPLSQRKQNLHIKAPIGVDSRPIGTEKNQGPETPDNSQISVDRKTSTPTNDGSNFPQEIDASAIHSEISMLSTVKKHKPKTGDTSTSHWHSSFPGQAKVKDTAGIVKNISHQNTDSAVINEETRLMQFNRYLLISHLDRKAKKVFQEKQRQAMAQNQWAYEEVERLRAASHNSEKELSRLKHRNKLDEQLSLQKHSLQPISDKIKGFSSQYDTLARALDVTRHQIPVDDIYLPKDDEQYQNQLVSLLDDSEHLLGLITSMNKQSLSNVSSTANGLLAIDKAIDKECEELERCRNEIMRTEKYLLEEMALKRQELQESH